MENQDQDFKEYVMQHIQDLNFKLDTITAYILNNNPTDNTNISIPDSEDYVIDIPPYMFTHNQIKDCLLHGYTFGPIKNVLTKTNTQSIVVHEDSVLAAVFYNHYYIQKLALLHNSKYHNCQYMVRYYRGSQKWIADSCYLDNKKACQHQLYTYYFENENKALDFIKNLNELDLRPFYVD